MLTRETRSRSPYFNEVFGAMIRTMVENYCDSGTAYAMDRTGRFYTESELKEDNSKIARSWRDLQWNFGKLTMRRQQSWRERVFNKYHSLQALVENLSKI
jgi:hypothetical protein